MERVFEPFAQGDSQLTRRYGGTGLGLAITRRIVAMMGGRVSVFSTPGEGSTFTLNLPLEEIAPDPAMPREKPLAGLRCVVRESSSYIAQDIAAYLKHAGAEVKVDETDDTDATGLSMLVCGLKHVRNLTTPPSVPHLVIASGRGRRTRARLVSERVTEVDGAGLSYGRLVEAAALCVGRLQSHVDTLAGGDAERGYADSQSILPILVAEDDPMNQKVIRRQLGLLNLRAEFACNGEEALILARFGRYSLLLTDLHMPDMDGYALARRIREEEIRVGGKADADDGAPSRRLPILALTADARQEVVDTIREAGMDGLLIKPVTLKTLDAALRPWLTEAAPPAPAGGKHKDAAPATPAERAPESAVAGTPVYKRRSAARNSRPATPAEQPAQPETVPHAEVPVLDLSELAARIGDDEEMQHEFLNLFREQMTPLTTQIQEAANAHDLDRIGALAHRLKSTSRAVGAMDLGALCARIEDACRKEDIDELSPLLARFGLASDAVGSAITRAVGSAGHVRH